MILTQIQNHKEEYQKHDKIYVYCRMGFRARIGGSMLERSGITNYYIIPEPWTEIKQVAKVVPYQEV